MALILPGNVASATADAGYNVANSCRFNNVDSPSLHIAIGSGATNALKFTFSAWVKKCLNVPGPAKSGAHTLFDIDGTNTGAYFSDDHDRFTMNLRNEGDTNYIFRTTRKFRDNSAWLHVCVGFDSTQATEGNRVTVEFNGVEETVWDSEVYPDQNYDAGFNGGTEADFRIGANDGSTKYFEGYMAEVVCIDGTKYSASDFGEFDEDSPTIWKPKDVSGLTFGNKGFYLDFEDSSNLGNDANGGTDLTETNIAAVDQATDTPTNNFCTLNPLNATGNGTEPAYSEGNVQSICPSSGGGFIGSSSIGVSSGKWFFELQRSAGSSGNLYIGIGDEKQTSEIARQSAVAVFHGDAVYYRPDDGNKQIVTDGSGAETSYGATYGTGDIIGIALNMDDNQVTFYKNGASQGAISIPTPDGFYFLNIINGTDSAETFQINFGNPPYANSSSVSDANGYGDFEYAVPSGYYSICTKNLGAYGG